LSDPVVAAVDAAQRLIPAAALTALAWMFGRSLRRGATPLIERIARVGTPSLPPALCRYTRRLTGLWAAYFGLAAVVSLAAPPGLPYAGAAVGLGSVVFFVGERWLRERLFPGQPFPGLVQQLRDTWSVWRRRP
jgi:uncharacterized membrane protein